jgi:hypothetical protein
MSWCDFCTLLLGFDTLWEGAMKLGVFLLGVLPLSAYGQVLTVSYRGTVYHADDGAPYGIGDTVAGTLLVDRLLMGPDLAPLDPNTGIYGADSRLPTANFVTGFATGMPANDSIYVRNDFDYLNGHRVDTYQIVDNSGWGTSSYMHLLLAADLPATTFDDDAGDQTFDAISRSLGDLVGTIGWGFEESWRQVDFYLSSFSVRPGRCAP